MLTKAVFTVGLKAKALQDDDTGIGFRDSMGGWETTMREPRKINYAPIEAAGLKELAAASFWLAQIWW